MRQSRLYIATAIGMGFLSLTKRPPLTKLSEPLILIDEMMPLME